MRILTASVIALGMLVAAGPGTALAQNDHLKCYRIKDTAKFKANVDLNAFQQQFNIDPNCDVKGKGKLFCVPVEKSVNSLAYPSNSTLSPIVMPGQDLEDDRICYRVKCPVNGQFADEEVQVGPLQLFR